MIVIAETNTHRISITEADGRRRASYEIRPSTSADWIEVERDVYFDTLATARLAAEENTSMWLSYLLDHIRRSA